ncbi:MAG TPA: Asp-tRNA(Asn)/Glu-tRNA(Gln) amidotransferase GatCAB subunit A [Gammaproteobacteria bacterium]|nr:Asp-tRNA(Asn)/Glu-tRNA(Gln) amidotransferase GatCAB subunit A [Gammaproteobacteria bacterium]
MSELTKMKVAGARDALRAGEVTSVELTEACLSAIEEAGALNAYVHKTPESALEQARAADARIKAGDAPAMCGIPMGIKDLFCTRGVASQAASRILEGFRPEYESTVTGQLFDAGAVMLGKLNMDEFAMGSSNETSYYGPVKNPWQTEHVPGGSSGGSAAAVAARLTPAATGTDTGGSIRQPASLCGITGLKPTYGRVSRWGMIAFASSLDQGGPMTQTAEDAALLMNAMAGFDPKDSTSTDIEVPDYTASLTQPLDGLRIGLPRQFFEQGLDADVGKVVQEAIAQYEKLGATLVDIELPNTHLSIPAYYVVAPAEASSNLSRFDGVRFGYRCKDPADLEDLYKRSRGEGFGEEVKRRIMIGTYALSAGYYDAYYLKAQKVRRLIKNDFDEAFNNVDVIMGPTAPNAGFKLGEKAADPVSMYLSDIYTISVNMAGLPGISIPAGMSNGLPVGLQIIGNYFDESRLLNVAHRYQQETGWHAQLPAAFA